MESRRAPERMLKAFACAALLLTSAACRDLRTGDGSRRLEDEHILAGRPAEEGGPSVGTADLRRGYFVANDAGLAPLVSFLRTRVGGSLAVKGDFDPRGEGLLTSFDPRLPGVVTGLPSEIMAALGVPFLSGVSIQALANEYRALCRHPLLNRSLNDAECDDLNALSGLGYLDNLTFGLESANVTARWEGPLQPFETLRRSSGDRLPPVICAAAPDLLTGICADSDNVCTRGADGSLRPACFDGFTCPPDRGGSPTAGPCVFGPFPCAHDDDCRDSPALPAGVCDRVAGRCTELSRRSQAGDFDDRRPVLVLTLPFQAHLDPVDALGGLIYVEISRLVVELRIQPIPCRGGGCATFDRVVFAGYRGTPAEDLRFSRAGVDLSVRSRMVGRDFTVVPTPLCPFAAIDPLGGSSMACLGFASSLPGTIDRALGQVSAALGQIVHALVRLPPLALGNGGAFTVTPDAVSMDLTPLPGEALPLTTPLGDRSGGWSQGTIATLARGGRIGQATLDLSSTLLPGTCSSCVMATGDLCELCADLCEDGFSSCDLRAAIFCPQLHGEPRPDCPGRVLDRRTLDYILGFLPGDLAVRDQVRSNLLAATTPIPAVPQLATLLDAVPNLAVTLQGIFTKPVERIGSAGQGEYADILWCPATGFRPSGCPESAVGAVFKLFPDSDGDGIPDERDNCRLVANPDRADRDGDGFGDACDLCPWTPRPSNLASHCACDIDHDECPNALLVQPMEAAPPEVPRECALPEGWIYDQDPFRADLTSAADDDGIPNHCDSDDDNDGLPDSSDNCDLVVNVDQDDENGDGLGDACDPLCHGDGLPICDPSFRDRFFEPGSRFGLLPGIEIDCLRDGPGCFGPLALVCPGAGIDSGCAEGGSLVFKARKPEGGGWSFLAAELGLTLRSARVIPDLDRDGLSEVAVGLVGRQGEATLLLLGGRNGKALHAFVDADPTFGSAVASLDGRLFVGAPGKGSAPGRVLVFTPSGKALGQLAGTSPGERFGSSLTVLDGALYIGAPGYSPSPQVREAGRFYRMTDPKGAPRVWASFQQAGLRMGALAPVAASVSGAKVLAGSPTASQGRGAVFALAPGGTVLRSWQGEPGSELGASLAAADFDGDGKAEVAVGAPGYGGAAGRVYLLDNAGTLRATALVGGKGHRLGTGLSASSGLGGNGRATLVVGVAGLDAGVKGAGAHLAVVGREKGLPPAPRRP